MRPAIFNLFHYLTVEKTRASFCKKSIFDMRTKNYASTGFSTREKDFRSIAGKRMASVAARKAMKANMAHHKP